MELIGKIFQVLPSKTGEGKNGTWIKQDLVLETDGKFPKKVLVSLFNKVIPDYEFEVGMNLKVSIDLESREYKDRWFTDVKAWKIDVVGATQTKLPVSDSKSEASETQIDNSPKDEGDGLPF